MKEKENETLTDEKSGNIIPFGAVRGHGGIITVTIIGQVEGHYLLPETPKTTKYAHVLPLLARQSPHHGDNNLALHLRRLALLLLAKSATDAVGDSAYIAFVAVRTHLLTHE